MFTTLLLALSLSPAAQPAADCKDVDSCRVFALEAAEQGAYERFHDLAWHAVQRGRSDDPALMLLLARAQTLSGRPGDALVMLRRVAAIGDAREALTSADFARVRALPGWPEVEAAILARPETRLEEPDKATPTRATPATAVGRKSPTPAGKTTRSTTAKPTAPDREKAVERPAEPEAPAGTTASNAVERTPEPATTPEFPGKEAVRLPATPLDPIGLAYDTVSRRFVVGDQRQNRLVVADEVFRHVNDLIGAGSGGFGTLTALEIDGRRGDLWVTSSDRNGATAVHKLQLVSGRVLTSLEVPRDLGPTTLGDIALDDDGELLLLDNEGSRVLTLDPSASTFGEIRLELPSPVSIARVNTRLYVAHGDGLSSVSLGSGGVDRIRAQGRTSLAGLRRIRAYQGSLIAVQQIDDHEPARLVRIRINPSRNAATRIDPLDDHVPADGAVLTISGNMVYYLASEATGSAIRGVALK